METKKVLMNWRGAPIGARTPDGSPGIGLTRRVGHVLRCGLTAVLMLFAAQGAWATAYGPGFENFSKSVSIDGKLHYSFDVMFFDWGGDNFFWRGQNVKGTGRTMLKVDGKELCADWGNHAETSRIVTINTDKGQKHSIRIEHYDNEANANPTGHFRAYLNHGVSNSFAPRFRVVATRFERADTIVTEP